MPYKVRAGGKNATGALGPPRARLRAEQICPAHTTSCLAPASCTFRTDSLMLSVLTVRDSVAAAAASAGSC